MRMSDDELTNIKSLQSSSDFTEQSIKETQHDDDEYQSKEEIMAVNGSFIKLTEVHFYDKIQRPKTKKKKKKKKKDGNNKDQESQQQYYEGEEDEDVDDEELKRMTALGLPTCFKSNKRKTRRGKNTRNEALREEQTTEQEKQQSATGIENSEEQVDHVHASASEVEVVGRKNELGKENEKYWAQRYRFFSKFDDGVVLDKEGWYSVTPEQLAAHIAYRCACPVIVDAFCGVGGNAIQFAKICPYVIAIDLDPDRIELARHNASVYGVADRIEFIVGDCTQLIPKLKADVVFLSPPWGGPGYIDDEEYRLSSMTPDFYDLFWKTREHVTDKIAFLLPRNTAINDFGALGYEINAEVEHCFYNHKFKAITAYFGSLANLTADEIEAFIAESWRRYYLENGGYQESMAEVNTTDIPPGGDHGHEPEV